MSSEEVYTSFVEEVGEYRSLEEVYTPFVEVCTSLVEVYRSLVEAHILSKKYMFSMEVYIPY